MIYDSTSNPTHPTKRTKANVVVIGAGIQGLSAAYHLAKIGIPETVVVEKETIGAGSSSRSACMLMLQRETKEKIELSKYSYSKYMEFEQETGVNPGFHKIGFLSVVTERVRSVALGRVKLRKSNGVKTEILNPDEIAELVPIVNLEDIVAGIYGPDDGVIDPTAIMDGYASKARELGASVETGTKAVGIQVKNEKVVGVDTTSGFIEAPWVVNAAGAAAIEVGSWVSCQLPIKNTRRSIYITAPILDLSEDAPMVEDAEMEWYYRKEGKGVLMGMGKEESNVASDSMNLEFLPVLRKFASHRAPVLGLVDICDGWSGIRPLTPDLNPILGPIEGLEGFVNSCGWGGEGIMHAPAGGFIIANYIAGKKNHLFDLGAFSLSRFPRHSS